MKKKEIDDIVKYEHPSEEIIKFQDEFLKKQMAQLIERINKMDSCNHVFDDGVAINNIVSFTCEKCGYSYYTPHITNK